MTTSIYVILSFKLILETYSFYFNIQRSIHNYYITGLNRQIARLFNRMWTYKQVRLYYRLSVARDFVCVDFRLQRAMVPVSVGMQRSIDETLTPITFSSTKIPKNDNKLIKPNFEALDNTIKKPNINDFFKHRILPVKTSLCSNFTTIGLVVLT